MLLALGTVTILDLARGGLALSARAMAGC